MTKKLIRLKPASEYADSAGYNMSFGMAGENTGTIKDSYKYRQLITSLTTCRESLVHSLRNAMLANDESRKPDVNNLRLVMAFSSKDNDHIKEIIFYAKQALNMMETKVGWENSVITTAKYIGNDNITCFLLTGSKNWMAAPQLISMVGLIMRSIYLYIKSEDRGQLEVELNNIEDVRALFNKIAKGDERDAEYIGICRKHFYNIMENYNKIFEEGPDFFFDINRKDADRKVYNYNSGYGGIASFCQNSSGSLLEKRFSMFVK
jgi:hypothetical protein